MLAISPSASAAIDAVLSAPDVPDGAGLRLSCAPSSGSSPAIALAIAEEPGPSDSVLEGASHEVFLEPQAAKMLDDQVLDAEIDADRVMFSLHPQSADGRPPE